jgi:hypothetical protein
LTSNPIHGKRRSKNGFLSLPAKEHIVQKIGIIAAINRLKIHEVVEMGTRATFPEYFVNE